MQTNETEKLPLMPPVATGSKPGATDDIGPVMLAEYRGAPTPQNLNRLVSHYMPVIQHNLVAIGETNNPYLRSRAKILAGDAIKSFDETRGADMKTWISQQMLRLRREKRRLASPMKVPERIMLDQFALHKAESEFIDRYDREPDLQELADFTKMSPKRITKVRQTFKRAPSESQLGEALPDSEYDYTQEAIAGVHEDSDHIDRRILEMKTGWGGQDILPPQVIAARLKLTPSQLSRRSARLALRINQAEDDLRSI